MNTTDKKVLVNKLSIAANYIDSKASGNVCGFYENTMGYTKKEARLKRERAIATYNTFKIEGWTDSEILKAALDTCTYKI